MQCDAVIFRRPDTPVVEPVEVPELEPDEVRVKTSFSGVSIGTERSIFSGARMENGSFPFVGGYMSSGVVEAVGDNCDDTLVGRRVVTHTSRLAGDVASIWGGHAGVQTTHRSLVAPIPDELDPAEASMFILPCVAYHAAMQSGIAAGQRVLIQGQGLIGQFFGQCARSRGAEVVVIEPNARRAELAERYVTQSVFSPQEASVEAVRAAFGGAGPDVVVEATGVGKLIDTAARHLTPGGRFVFLAWYPGSPAICLHTFHTRGVTAHFPTGAGGPSVFNAVLASLASGELVVGDNLTHRLAARDAPAGYRMIVEADPAVMGMTLDWGSA